MARTPAQTAIVARAPAACADSDSGKGPCADSGDADGSIGKAPCGAVANQGTAAASGNGRVDGYCRHGSSVAGFRHFVNLRAIDPKATTSDFCHTIIKPATAPSGWHCKPTLVDAEKA